MKKIAGIIFLSSFLALVGCSSKKKDTGMEGEQPMTTTTEEGSQLNISGDSDNKTAGGLTTVYFDFDSSTLRSDTKSALGERRAKAVMDYLTAMGIAASRITTISYGKEKPIAMGHDESSWSQNRRANFVITKK